MRPGIFNADWHTIVLSRPYPHLLIGVTNNLWFLSKLKTIEWIAMNFGADIQVHLWMKYFDYSSMFHQHHLQAKCAMGPKFGLMTYTWDTLYLSIYLFVCFLLCPVLSGTFAEHAFQITIMLSFFENGLHRQRHIWSMKAIWLCIIHFIYML